MSILMILRIALKALNRNKMRTALTMLGMIIGVAGTAAGAAVGFTLIWAQNTYKIIGLAADVYQIDYLPMKLSPGDFILVVGSTLALSLLATIIPARRAGALTPVDVLRYE